MGKGKPEKIDYDRASSIIEADPLLKELSPKEKKKKRISIAWEFLKDRKSKDPDPDSVQDPTPQSEPVLEPNPEPVLTPSKSEESFLDDW